MKFSHFIAWSGQTEFLAFIYKHDTQSLTCVDKYQRSAVHYAALSGNPQQLELVLRSVPGALLFKDRNQKLPVHYAAQSGNPKQLRYVLELKPDFLYSKDKKDLTATHYAALSGNPEQLEIIFNNYKEAFQKALQSKPSLVHYAALSGCIEQLQWVFIHDPCALERKDEFQHDLSYYAVASGSISLLKFLIKEYNPAKRDSLGCSIIHYAAFLGNLEALKLLTEPNPQCPKPMYLTYETKDKRTAAHFAAKSGKLEALRYILSIDKHSLKKQDHYGRTVVHYAALSGNQEILEYLLDRNQDSLNQLDASGLNICHFAAGSGNASLLNKVFMLTKSQKFIGGPLEGAKIEELKHVYSTLLTALENNYMITEVDFPYGVDSKVCHKIKLLVKRNNLLWNGHTPKNNSYFPSFFYFRQEIDKELISLPTSSLLDAGFSCYLSEEKKSHFFQDHLNFTIKSWSEKLETPIELLENPYGLLNHFVTHLQKKPSFLPETFSFFGLRSADKMIFYAPKPVNRLPISSTWDEVANQFNNFLAEKKIHITEQIQNLCDYIAYRQILGIQQIEPAHQSEEAHLALDLN